MEQTFLRPLSSQRCCLPLRLLLPTTVGRPMSGSVSACSGWLRLQDRRWILDGGSEQPASARDSYVLFDGGSASTFGRGSRPVAARNPLAVEQLLISHFTHAWVYPYWLDSSS